MASEIRVNKIENRSGLGTVTFADTGVDLAGIVTATTFSGSGASLTSLPAAQLTGALPAISGANLTGIAATDNVRTGILDVAGVGTFRGDVNIPDKIIHLGDTDTAIRFPAADTITAETGGSEHIRIASNGNITYSAASGENTIISKRTNSAGSNGNYFFHLNANNSDNNTVGSFGFHRDTATDDSRIVFSTRTSGGSNTERVRINSSGDLLYGSDRNYAFWYKAPTNSHSNYASSSSEILIFGTAVLANTDVYNTTNGRYTAPVDGLYFFRFNGLLDDNAGAAGNRAELYKNGSAYGSRIAYQTTSSKNSGDYELMSGTGIMYMDAGDYANLYCTAGIHVSDETQFLGYLIRGTI